MGRTVWWSSPGGVRYSVCRPGCSRGLPRCLYSGVPDFSPGWPESGVDQQPLSSGGLRIFRNYTTTFPLSVHRHIMGELRLFTFKINKRLFVCFWRDSSQWARTSPFTRFQDRTQRRTMVSRTPLDEWSTRRRDLYLTTHTALTTDKYLCPRWDSKPTVSASKRPQTYALRPRGNWDRRIIDCAGNKN